MTNGQQANDWAAVQGRVRQRAIDGGGAPGFATATQIQGKTGRQVLEAMMSGELPYPHLNESMGFDLMEVGDGLAVFQGVPHVRYYNPLGTLHGGWYCALLDSALGCAVQSKLPAGRGYTTAEISVNLVRSAPRSHEPLRAIGTVLHCGKQLATAEAKLVDASGRLYAHATTTCLVFAMPAAS